MKRKTYFAGVIVLSFIAALFLASCEPVEPEPTPTPTPMPTPTPAPQQTAWENSAHADETAEAFVHWDEDDPPEIPTSCAACHSETGFLDLIGADGSAAGTVDAAAPIGTVVSCAVCHTKDVTSVTFPSGVTLEGLGNDALCMTCHQGRLSKADVDSTIDSLGLDSVDTVSTELGFQNIHYHIAAATMYGTMVKGGYEYDGNTYDAKFAHVSDYDTCTDCHNAHSLEVEVEGCTMCHTGVSSADDFKDIRSGTGSSVDYDGDGDTSEGIYDEIMGLQSPLYSAIQAYAAEVAGTAIVYEAASYPYFFIDTNGNGTADGDEATYSNQYASWTPRLLKAAYNYQVSLKDPGGYVHGGKYIIQLLYDSIADINAALSSPVSMGGMNRNDEGHFDGSSEAWRHWDEDDPAVVEASCSKCHSSSGLPNFLTTGENAEEPLANGMMCSTCHNDDYSVLDVASVTLPSGMMVDLGDNSNLCMECHQGRESKSSVDNKLAEAGPYTFTNIHYYPVAAIFYGTDAQGAYEYDGKTYTGQMMYPAAHGAGYETCTECHMGSSHNVTDQSCSMCHPGDISDIRASTAPDYDGDGDTDESTREDIADLEDVLYEEIQRYAENTIEKPIIYASAYPYFFNDTDADGEADDDEASYGNRYVDFDATLLKAAFNYQASHKDPGAYIHNALYVAQILVDSIEDLGGDVKPYTWR